jgi:4-amino-4-deoxychorismate lyase
MTIEFPITAVNGQSEANISPLDRGFAYGDGVYETCRTFLGRIPLWSLHRERLLNSCKRLRIPCNPQQLDTYCQQLLDLPAINTLADGVLKVIVTRGISGRGYRIPDVSVPTYCTLVFEGTPLKSEAYMQGIKLRVCHNRLSTNPALAGLKHMNRLEQVLARSEWGNEYHDGLMLDGMGNVIETTSSNLFVVINDELITPDLSQTGVEGVMRRLILERLAPAINLTPRINAISLADIQQADEVFICNSLAGVLPVVSVAFEPSAVTYKAGSVARQLQTGLEMFFADPSYLQLSPG